MPRSEDAARASNGGAAGAAGVILANRALGMLADVLRLLHQIAEQGPSHLAVGAAGMQQRLDNWPIAGETRIITGSQQFGQVLALAAATAADVFQSDAGRGGANITNSGANPATLFLCLKGDQTGGAAQLYLAAGASWDGRVSDQVWCGPVSAISPLGTTLVVAAV